MSTDKDKLLQIMASLESDYAHGKISREKYIYFRSKYEDKLNALDAREATNRIRSMQGKPSDSPKKVEKPSEKEIKEKEDLVQKYIINPKKGDKQLKEKTPMDSGTFKLVAILILAVGFTVGAAFGVFNFDFQTFSETNAVAIVTDTAFPDVADIHVNTTKTVSNTTYVQNTTDSSSVQTYQDTSTQSYDTGQDSSSSSSQGSGQSPSQDSGSQAPAQDTGQAQAG